MREILQRRIHLHDVKKSENDIIHYNIAEIMQPDGQTEIIQIGDTGLFFSRGIASSSSSAYPPNPYIGMIIDIYTKGEPLKPYFRIRWFYRASEIPVIEGFPQDVSIVFLNK